ncbi:hypothetical protein [Sandaracinus amylolyticus]|uniref:hypothetical protein n=1 Tax=Sandaracinus amylolyticus TaxID=927083 RepID=UPI001F172E67|nr:hypothetical protein [Sandaracinus amylolyticus]UJR78478.1 Hypothetical protein I5071_5080 [Sandaracinus amylolyticus]
MRKGSAPLVAAALVAALSGCGGGSANEVRTSAGKTDAPGGERLSQPVSRSPVPGATRPARDEDISLRAFAQSPVGVIDEDHANGYVVRLEVHNASADPITLERVWVHASIYQNGLLVHGCDEGALELVTASLLELQPGQGYAINHVLPCALSESGRYDLVSVVVVGMPPGAEGLEQTLRFSQSVATPLVVDADLPAFSAERDEAEETAAR